MPAAQTAYTTRPAIGLPGQVANAELANVISRTVESAAGIAFGQPCYRGSGDHGVIKGATYAATAVGAAAAGNTGAGTITASPAVVSPAMAGVYRVIMVATGATGAFIVENPDGVQVGDGVVGTEAVVDGITFTVADPGGDPTVGDVFTITVTYTANAKFVGLAVQNPAVAPDASTPDAFAQYATAAVMTQGHMYVTVGAAVADGDPVYWNPATSRFTKDTGLRIPGATFDTTATTNGDIAEVSIKNR